jgi:hypothetical protein
MIDSPFFLETQCSGDTLSTHFFIDEDVSVHFRKESLSITPPQDRLPGLLNQPGLHSRPSIAPPSRPYPHVAVENVLSAEATILVKSAVSAAHAAINSWEGGATLLQAAAQNRCLDLERCSSSLSETFGSFLQLKEMMTCINWSKGVRVEQVQSTT